MAYNKTTWQNGVTPINETNLNKIEDELEVVDKSLKYNGYAPSDLNDATTFGIYHLNGTYDNSPSSSTIWGVLIVYESLGEIWTPGRTPGSWIWQEIRMTNGKIYRRKATDTSDSWSEWEQQISTIVDDTWNTSKVVILSSLYDAKLIIIRFASSVVVYLFHYGLVVELGKNGSDTITYSLSNDNLTCTFTLSNTGIMRVVNLL